MPSRGSYLLRVGGTLKGDLKAKLRAWNQKIGPERLICWIWFRDWAWYCGNGGS